MISNKKIFIWALTSSLLLPIPYQHCFDSCNWFPWPIVVPGFHWLAFFAAGTYTNLFIFIIIFAIFYFVLLLANQVIQNFTCKKFYTIIIITWLILVGLLQFNKFTQNIFLDLSRIIETQNRETKKDNAIANCSKYQLDENKESLKLTSNFIKGGDIELRSYAGGRSYFVGFNIDKYTSTTYGSISGDKANQLFTKFNKNNLETVSINVDECYSSEKPSHVVLCFKDAKIVAKMCFIDPVVKSVAEFSDYLLLPNTW